MSTRFFLDKKICEKLKGIFIYLVPPELDINRLYCINNVDIIDVDKKLIGIELKNSITFDISYLLKDKKFLISIKDVNSITDGLSIPGFNNEIGKSVIDNKFGLVGKVKDIAGTNAQKMLCIDNNGYELLIPYVDKIVLNQNNNIINVNLPEGLLELNK